MTTKQVLCQKKTGVLHLYKSYSWFDITTRECDFSHTKTHGSWHMWGKLCGFIHYNVQYMVFILTYVTLKLQLDIKLWHMWLLQKKKCWASCLAWGIPLNPKPFSNSRGTAGLWFQPPHLPRYSPGLQQNKNSILISILKILMLIYVYVSLANVLLLL
jgi:hypothetical protein